MRFRYALLALLLAAPGLAQAQESAAVLTAKAHLQNAAQAPGDANLAATDVVVDRRSGATFVYLTQTHNGIPVFGTTSAVAVSARGQAHAVRPAFVTGVAARAEGTTASVDAQAAISSAEGYVRQLAGPMTPQTPIALSDNLEADAAKMRAQAQAARVTYTASTPELVYQPVEGGALRLAWSFILTADRGAMQVWGVRVDAQTGALLAADDMVDRDQWVSARAPRGSRAPVSLAPVAQQAAMVSAARVGSYRVIPVPFESPSHGDFALVSDPANAAASPQGWHNTGTESFTITRGNNVWAYEDRNGSNSSSSATSSPDGGAGLVFDFPFDPTRPPVDNIAPAVTNLFYWNNIVHDVLWHFGFDEPAGNYQVNNFGNGGNGGDAVRAEAQDCAECTPPSSDNANFNSGGPDGGSGRMQMFEWTPSPIFEVTAPTAIAQAYPAGGPAETFTAIPDGVSSGAITVGLNATGGFAQGCTVASVTNGGNVSGNIVAFRRGDCSFATKILTGQALGATGVVISNCDPEIDFSCNPDNSGENILNMACLAPDPCGTITTRSLFVQQSTGDLLYTNRSNGLMGSVSLGGVNRDSDFDNGVIAHEYGHGVSNRLTGGPGTTACLGNQEQMGEGWSDFIGLMLTQQADDTGELPRGIGTYVDFQATNDVGIRNAPYSTSFDVNDYTYQDVITSGGGAGPRGLSIPHGIGFAWSSMIWDMNWNLIRDNGYSSDLYNGDGTAGNQIALNLVMQGMKLQPCQPGFVDGRNAILEADTLLYGGQYSAAIWEAFARRGLGVNASQGSSANVNDGVADFTTPPVATQTTPNGGVVSLVLAGPNPAHSATRVALALDVAQSVRVDVVDLLGRRVATLHDGPLTADAPHLLPVSTASLAPGVYIVRAVGENFSLAERITVAR